MEEMAKRYRERLEEERNKLQELEANDERAKRLELEMFDVCKGLESAIAREENFLRRSVVDLVLGGSSTR